MTPRRRSNFISGDLLPVGKEKVLARAPAAMIQLVLDHFSAEGVTVNAEEFRGSGLIAIGAVQNALDEALLELTDGLIE
jgi:hypothetical protein